MPVKIEAGEILRLRKKHPCGGDRFEVMRSGMDFRIKCLTCGSQMRIDRRKLEKSIAARLDKQQGE